MTGIKRRSAIQLRPYQQEAIAAIEAGIDRGIRRPLVVIPTGAGKTIIFASLIARRGGSALVLAHRDELLRQAADKITQADPTLGLGVGVRASRPRRRRRPGRGRQRPDARQSHAPGPAADAV